MKKAILILILILGIVGAGWAQTVPNHPSDVYMQGNQLMIRRCLPDGSRRNAETYVIKGIDWNPATFAPASGPDFSSPPNYADYGFFFDWPGRDPQGHEFMNYWFGQELNNRYEADLRLIADMNANTIRLYGAWYRDDYDYTPILDECYRKGIMVIMTVAMSKEDIDSGKYLRMVNNYKFHPAILMWSLGNEWNFNLYYGYADLSAAAAATQQAASAIQNADQFHPVSSCLGDNPNDFSVIALCRDVDIWGLNFYRDPETYQFWQFFEDWRTNIGKPFYLSEFGTDSFRTTGFTQDGGRAKACSGYEDQSMQNFFIGNSLYYLRWYLSVLDDTMHCAGGLVFEFNDELWKAGNYNVGLGGLIDYTNNHSYYEYNSEGFTLRGHPDAVANEEHFGVVDSHRIPKDAYNMLSYAYLALEKPFIYRFEPSLAEPGQEVSIIGWGSFGPDPITLKFDDRAVDFTKISSAELHCTVPNDILPGPHFAYVTSRYGTSYGGFRFDVVIRTPVISSVNLSSGLQGSIVIITGNRFGATQGTGRVLFADNPADVIGWSNTSIICNVPGLAVGTYPVTVTTSGGTSNSVNFIVQTPAPVITSCFPSSGRPALSSMFIYGARLTSPSGSSVVQFAGINAEVQSAADDLIICIVPDLSGGIYPVTVTTADGVTSNAMDFTVFARRVFLAPIMSVRSITYPQPSVQPVSPDQATIVAQFIKAVAPVINPPEIVVQLIRPVKNEVPAQIESPDQTGITAQAEILKPKAATSQGQAKGASAIRRPQISSLSPLMIKRNRSAGIVIKGADFGAKKGKVEIDSKKIKVISWDDGKIVIKTGRLKPGAHAVKVITDAKYKSKDVKLRVR